jgi:hypothetical protein
VIAFLCSERASYVSGVAVNIDGGRAQCSDEFRAASAECRWVNHGGYGDTEGGEGADRWRWAETTTRGNARSSRIAYGSLWTKMRSASPVMKRLRDVGLPDDDYSAGLLGP